MDKLYNVIIKNDCLEFRFIVKTNTKENAEDMAIEYLVDSEEFNNQVSSSKTILVEEIKEGGVISFNVYDSN